MRRMDLKFRRRRRCGMKTINMASHIRLAVRQLLRAKNGAHFRLEAAVIHQRMLITESKKIKVRLLDGLLGRTSSSAN